MWQALLAAAVAGSTGFVARRLLDSADPGVIDNDAVFRFSSADSKKKKKKKKGARVLERSEKRRFGLSLKRRKLSANVAGIGNPSSQDSSLFSWGLGVGMMCMMSAGRAEFGKLNTAVAETAKVVEELKAELHDRKSPSNHGDNIKDPGEINDGECVSVLTEEHVSVTLDMDALEAELEFELQKLPWCPMETSEEEQLSVQGFPEPMKRDSNTSQVHGNGVSPEELDQKLCHLLIERQGSQIEELESELTSAQKKLHEKEAELQALKDCVKRLTAISISTFSDDESEAVSEIEHHSSDWDCKMVGQLGSGSIGVGMKRPIDSQIM